MVTQLALAEPELKIRKHVTVEAVWIKFDEIQLVVKFQQFQKKPKCSAMASRTRTDTFCWANRKAALRPPAPLPTTIASKSVNSSS